MTAQCPVSSFPDKIVLGAKQQGFTTGMTINLVDVSPSKRK